MRIGLGDALHEAEGDELEMSAPTAALHSGKSGDFFQSNEYTNGHPRRGERPAALVALAAVR